MPHTRSIDNTSPALTDDAGNGYLEIQHKKVDDQERLELDHYWDSSQDTTTKIADGFHKKVSLASQDTDPVPVADQAVVFAKLVNTDPQIHCVSPGSPVGVLSPVGMLAPYAGTAAPSGWFLCYGQAISRTTYSALFAVIGTQYGAGNGTTTFNLPDLRGRTIIGLDNLGGVSANRVTDSAADSLGGNGGEEEHQLTINETPSHAHTTYSNYAGFGGGSDLAGLGGGGAVASTTTSVGGDQPHNNMQPFMALSWIIKA